ncbi:hypothetical protein C1645_829702 [Glomus cerebriforme]|uniref:Uncharacterized protein n=1 Tax=Glomus cerebriforme TaxID=658196 RepID=A0A397SNH9_9GLOM|nr:hypothetical protein C1645_829702 [Glomus cerebriforme]
MNPSQFSDSAGNFQPSPNSTLYNLQDDRTLNVLPQYYSSSINQGIHTPQITYVSNQPHGNLDYNNAQPQSSPRYHLPLQTTIQANSFGSSTASNGVYLASAAPPTNKQQDYNAPQFLPSYYLSLQTIAQSPTGQVSNENVNNLNFVQQNSHSSNQDCNFKSFSIQLPQKTFQTSVQTNSFVDPRNHYVHKFFFQPSNDLINYHIKCEKISLHQLLNNSTQFKESEYIFYYQQQSNNQIYQISCEIASSNYLNKNFYGIEIKQIMEQELAFTPDQKENLRCHLTRYLIRHLLN